MDAVSIFPDDATLIWLATTPCIEENDEWSVVRRYLSAGSMGPLLEDRLPSPRYRGSERARTRRSSEPASRRTLAALTRRPGT
jgi:hypothetical protein